MGCGGENEVWGVGVRMRVGYDDCVRFEVLDVYPLCLRWIYFSYITA